MAHNFNRDDGTFAQVDYSDLSGSAGGNNFTTTHTVLVSENTTSFGYISPGNSGQVLTSTGAGSDPTFQAVGASFTTTHAVLLSESAGAFGYANPQGAGRLLTDNGAGSDPTFQAFSTSHAVLLSSSTGFAYASPGTSGQVLTSNGSTSNPTFLALPTSSLVLITSHTMNAVASLDDSTSFTGYTNYLMRGYDISLTTATSLNQQFSNNGGTSYFSSAGNYQSTVYGSNSNAGTVASSFTNRSGFNITAIVSSATIPLTFETLIFNPGGSFQTAFRVMVGYPTASGNREALHVDGYLGAAGMNAARWTLSAGTMSGVIEIFGLL